MNSRPDLRARHALELIDRLLRVCADFAAREEVIEKEFAKRRSVVNRAALEKTRRAEAAVEARVQEITAFYQAQDDLLTSAYEARRTRIREAEKVLRSNIPWRAHAIKERTVGRLQLKAVTAERKMKADAAKLDKEYEADGQRLTQQQPILHALEARADVAFGGYAAFGKMLAAAKSSSAPENADKLDHRKVFEELKGHLAAADERLGAFTRLGLPKLFRIMPLPVLLLVVGIAAAVAVFALGLGKLPVIGLGLLIAGAALIALHGLGRRTAQGAAEQVVASLRAARASYAAFAAAATGHHERETARVQGEYDRIYAELSEKWKRYDEGGAELEAQLLAKLNAQVPRVTAKNVQHFEPRIARIAAERAKRIGAIQAEAEADKKLRTQAYQGELDAITAEEEARWVEVAAAWRTQTEPIYEEIAALNAAAAAQTPAWDAALVEGWQAPAAFSPFTAFGRFDLDLAKHPSPKNTHLATPRPRQLSLPLALDYPRQGSLLFETNESGSAEITRTLNNIVLRLLATTPPGKIAFTIIDPVGLGENFAGLMHLADYEEAVINRKIWTQRDQIEERLIELNEHIEKVIQMYLRNEYATISEYNEQAGSVAEKYQFLIVADFPAGFSESAAKRLQSIAASGPRCGVFTLIHWDQRHVQPDGLQPDELRKSAVVLRRAGVDFIAGPEQAKAQAALVFDPPPPDELALAFVHKAGKASIDSNRVEVPFTQIAPKPEEMWKNDTTSELRIAIGRTGATKQQMLAIGKGTRQHALFAGKTGSGKSTLFHVIITNLALACSPEQVEFYLIDFKKGVEFKCYATHRLPHARVVAIESDREFALSVLRRVDEELKRRGDLFRALGVQDIPGYKRAGGTEPMPRSLLLIDEFQEFFVDDDAVAQEASLLFDRIVRQGRAFGIHVLLGSQTLGGAYTLARATLGQMVIRVALQCNEADAYLIMDESNAAPRLLSRPGEGIYNDSAGAIEGNSPFQVCWLGDDERDRWLEKVRALAVERGDQHPGPIVFEGNAPADVRENHLLNAALATPPEKAPSAARCWLGAPNAIKGPTEAIFRRQSGNHLLIVGQRDEPTQALLAFALISLAAQFPSGSAQLIVVHAGDPQEPDCLERTAGVLPGVRLVRAHEIQALMSELEATLKARAGGEQLGDSPSIFVLIHGLQKFKKLRQEDDFSFSSSDEASAGAQFNDLITEGSTHGIHLLLTVDTFNNVTRSLSRKAQSEFEMRVVFQMSANDSASLIDNPRASNLGLHRALLYNEHEGSLETFRPYAAPEKDWLAEVAGKITSRG